MILAVLVRKVTILITYLASIFDIVEWSIFQNVGSLINKIPNQTKFAKLTKSVKRTIRSHIVSNTKMVNLFRPV